MIHITLLLLLSSCCFTQINAMDNDQALDEWMAPFANTDSSSIAHAAEQNEISFADEYYQTKEDGECLYSLKHDRSPYFQKQRSKKQLINQEYSKLKHLIKQEQSTSESIEEEEDIQTHTNTIVGYKQAIALIVHDNHSVRVRKNNKACTKGEYLRDAREELRFIVSGEEDEDESESTCSTISTHETESQSDDSDDDNSEKDTMSCVSFSESAYYRDQHNENVDTERSQIPYALDWEFGTQLNAIIKKALAVSKLNTVTAKNASSVLKLDASISSFANQYRIEKGSRSQQYAKKMRYHERDRKTLLVAKSLSNVKYGRTHAIEKDEDESELITHQEIETPDDTGFLDNTPQQTLISVPVYNNSTKPMTYNPKSKPPTPVTLPGVFILVPTRFETERIVREILHKHCDADGVEVTPLSKGRFAIMVGGTSKKDATARTDRFGQYLGNHGCKETGRLHLQFESTQQ